MLCQFTFENFASYKDSTTLDMQAASIQEMEEKLIVSKDKRSFLPVAAIYGANGGGKTKALEALYRCIAAVMLPYVMLTANREIEGFSMLSLIACAPFAFDEKTVSKPTVFEVFYRTQEAEYQYGLSVSSGKIVSESLFRRKLGATKPAMLFQRQADEPIKLGNTLKTQIIMPKLNDAMPCLAVLAATHSIQNLDDAMSFFTQCVFLRGDQGWRKQRSFFALQNVEKKLMLQSMHNLDINVVDYEIETDDKGEPENILLIKDVAGKRFKLDFEKESAGTQKLFALLPYALNALTAGGLLLVDELDASLHPKLLRYVIQLFKDPQINHRGAQLIFNTHDLTTMTNEVFRRDEILFACRNNEEASELYSLYDLRDEKGDRIRSDAQYNKQYLAGRYGADPYLSRMADWRAGGRE